MSPLFAVLIATLVILCAGISAAALLNASMAFVNALASETARAIGMEARAYALRGEPMSAYASKLYQFHNDTFEVRFISDSGIVYPATTSDEESLALVRAARAIILFNVRPAVERIPGGHVLVVVRPVVLARLILGAAGWIALVALIAGFLAFALARRIVSGTASSLDALATSISSVARGDIAPLAPVDAFDRRIAASVERCNTSLTALSDRLGAQREASVRMQQFTAEAGHQLRTPITIILGYLDVISRGAVSEPAAVSAILDKMRAEARSMRTMISDLIYLARLDQAAQPSRQLIDLTPLLREAAESLGLHGALLDDEPTAFILGHRNELFDAFRNVFDNAMRHGAEPVHACVRVLDADVIVEIHDCGTGIDQADAARVFDRFFRGANADGVEGSGLGLAIAKRAIERSDGTIRIGSDNGSGTTVAIALPRVDATTG